MPLAAPTIEVSHSYPQIVWWTYHIDQQTLTAIWQNFKEGKSDDRDTPRQKTYARKPEELELPTVIKTKPKYPENPNHVWSLSHGHRRPSMNSKTPPR